MKDGAALSLDPLAGPLTVGKNLIIENGLTLTLPRKLPPDWTPVLHVRGTITGELEAPPHAYMDLDPATGTVFVKLRPIGTLLMVR